MALQGRVEKGVVVFLNGRGSAPLPDGTLVEVTPLPPETAAPEPIPVSQEQREALLGLIGLWKIDNPPNDEEVERIIEEHRMKKYG
jgi:hypothetical protein